MAEVWKDDKIRYWDLAPKLFPGSGVQEVIPFLGAGVSVSARHSDEKTPDPAFPTPEVMSQICALLDLTEDKARLYLEFGIRTALWMQAWEKLNGAPPSRENLISSLESQPYPPFGWELAELFSLLAPYRALEETALPAIRDRKLLPPESAARGAAQLLPMLQLFIRSTRVASPTDPLTSISSYYECHSKREDLWKWLQQVFSNKTTPTETHRLMARAAHHHLTSKPCWEDYLIITTNYDCLMERALEELEVPFAAVRMNRKERKFYTRFAQMPADELQGLTELNPPQSPDQFNLKKGSRSLVILYKMHGCLAPDLKDEQDGLVITDEDYVDFISHATQIIPSHVGALLPGKTILFLGYSFSDWNVRSIYETVVRRTGEDIQDYAVTRALSEFERTYFDKKNIILILSGLDEFSAGVRSQGGVPIPS
ncbi:MAG: SIR2 family protein [Bryobacteraceae bacterium]